MFWGVKTTRNSGVSFLVSQISQSFLVTHRLKIWSHMVYGQSSDSWSEANLTVSPVCPGSWWKDKLCFQGTGDAPGYYYSQTLNSGFPSLIMIPDEHWALTVVQQESTVMRGCMEVLHHCAHPVPQLHHQPLWDFPKPILQDSNIASFISIFSLPLISAIEMQNTLVFVCCVLIYPARSIGYLTSQFKFTYIIFFYYYGFISPPLHFLIFGFLLTLVQISFKFYSICLFSLFYLLDRCFILSFIHFLSSSIGFEDFLKLKI